MSGHKDEFQPLLGPGLHSHTLADLRRLCVNRFPESITRPSLMDNLQKVIELLGSKNVVAEVWIDGSFLTEKLNPDDVDLVVIVEASDYANALPETKAFVAWFGSNSMYARFKCDNYLFVRDDSSTQSDYVHAYWLRQFGFSRGNQMKGIAVLRSPQMVSP